MKKFIPVILLSFIFGGIGAFTFWKFNPMEKQVTEIKPASFSHNNVSYHAADPENIPGAEETDFIKAASKSRPSVVFIKGTVGGNNNGGYGWDLFFDFFKNRAPSFSYGSGVIISSDGYIVTNNHVIKDANQIEVRISNSQKPYIAKVVGTDPSTDLAVLKIDAKNLPAIEFSNSESLQIGEWVLAVGNPFNLTSTVTAGIVSAKGRNVGVVQNQFPIESFIQTDAAINPGNSGGALVKSDGKLVGINTAILSQTGSYAGYGFAIPSNIVKKISSDIITYGIVQRAFIEAEVQNVDEALAQKLGNEELSGAVVTQVFKNGAADKAGMQKGDIITSVNEREVTSRSRFDELLAYQRPGDKIDLTVLRNGQQKDLSVILTNSNGTTDLVKYESVSSNYLGAEFSNLSKVEKERYGIDYGVRVKNIQDGLIRKINLPEDFIILSVNNQVVGKAEELVNYLEKARGRVIIKGISPAGNLQSYGIYVY